jgi:photosystem II stability/assembly factor-like uncharacterized protein
VKSGPYTCEVLGLLVKDNSVFVSTYYWSNIIYSSGSDGEGWTKRDSGFAFGTWIAKGDQIFGSGNSCIYSSVDNGSSWQPINGSPGAVRDFALSGDTIWAGINDSYNAVLLYFSADNGITWVLSGSPISPGIASIDVLLSNGNTLIAGTDAGCYTTTDKGQHWKRWDVNSGNSGVECLAKVDSNTIIAGAYHTLCITNNNGQNWVMDEDSSSFRDFHDFAQYGNRVFAAADEGVYVSADKGWTWTQYNAGLPADKSVLHIVISDTMAYLGTRGGGLYSSSVNRIYWMPANKGMDIPLNVTAIAVKDGLVYAGTKDYGMYISTDYGISWRDYNSGFPRYGMVTDLLIDGNKTYAASNLNGVSVDSAGTAWISPPLFTPVSLIEKFGDYLFVNSDNHGLIRYANSSLNQPVDTTYFKANAMATDGDLLFTGTDAGIYTSDDLGKNWKKLEGTTNWVNALFYSGPTLFVAENAKGISVSTDKGKTWKLSNTGIPDPEWRNYNSFAAIGENIYLGSDNEIFVTTNHGDSWIPVFTGFPADMFVYGIAANAQTLFASTSNEMWQCKNCNSTIGIDEKSSLSGIRVEVYPNPSKGNFCIVAEDQVISQISVYNSSGICLFQKNLTNLRLSCYNVDIEANSGLYFIRVVTDKGEVVKKQAIVY